jgi:hypothetical protein
VSWVKGLNLQFRLPLDVALVDSVSDGEWCQKMVTNSHFMVKRISSQYDGGEKCKQEFPAIC